MKRFLSLIGLVIGTGCTTPIYVPKVIDRPVMVYCHPDPVPHSLLPLVRKPPFTAGQVLAGAKASLLQLSTENQQLREQINLCEGREK